jgi:glycosyltransferase involved in cell wall biosynthesis
MKLSIIVTTLSDPDLENTIRSIRETAGLNVEIVVVNDNGQLPASSLKPSELGEIKFITNSHRCGVGPSRTIGVHHAKGEYVLIIDSHMRFAPGWYEEALRRIEGRPHTIHCATMAGLDATHMDVSNPASLYYGGTINVFGKDPNNGSKSQILESVWNKTPPDDDAEIASVLGASYFMPRDWFLKLDALRHLRTWGSDETSLSIKSWLAGGDCRLMRNVIIGHVYQAQGKQPFKVPYGHTLFNRLFLIHTLLPDALRDELLEKMPLTYGGGEFWTAKKMIEENWHLIEVERARNHAMFVRDFGWLREKFQL